MRILKHIAMAGFIAFLLSPEKSRQREDIRDHSIDVVVVIDDTGCVARVLTCSLFESIKVSKERSISIFEFAEQTRQKKRLHSAGAFS